MPIYSFYPQARGSQGEKIDAILATPEDARARADEILAAHPDAAEVSIWCDDVYVGRVGNIPWTPPARAATGLSAAARLLPAASRPRSRRPRAPKADATAPQDR